MASYMFFMAIGNCAMHFACFLWLLPLKGMRRKSITQRSVPEILNTSLHFVTHCSVVKKKGVPTDIKQFFQYCRNKGIATKLHVYVS